MRGIFKALTKMVLSFLQKSSTKKVLGVLLFFSITILILFSHFSPKQVMLKPDEVARQDIQSPVNALITDKKQTMELQRQAASKVQKVYQEDKYALDKTWGDINNFYDLINQTLEAQPEDAARRVQEILTTTNNRPDAVKITHSKQQLTDYILNSTPEDREHMRQASLNVVGSLMEQPVTEEALAGVFEQVRQRVNRLGFAPQAGDIVEMVCVSSLHPNLIYNSEATDKAVREAIDEVKPVQKSIKAEEIIVRAGDRVTEDQISTLEQLGLQRSKSYPFTLVGAAIFVLLTFWLTIEFLRRYYKEIYGNDMLMLLIGLVFLLVLALSRLVTVIKIGDQPSINALVGYLAPVAAGSMLIAILLDNRLAYFMTAIMALYVGLLNDGNQLFYAITAFVGGTVGVFQVYRMKQTSDQAKASIYIALANVISIITLSFIGGNITLNLILAGIIIGAVNGILSTILMIGALPYLETAFSITSMIRLLELSNPNHDLLKRLLLEAPGTYHHSLMVGNLAEASAESIGANPLLVRVGSYYHDIGKIKRSEYFVENQRGFENPHEKIAPALSALIITSHVKEGLELAREARLPQVIVDFIEQHHGTSLAKYFYSRALEEDPEGTINEETFRYQGPKPQSKEVALVMLADSVEAAVRSLQDPSPEKIRNMVRRIIKDKLDDGQLEACDLTFRDLDTIARSFCKVLEGVYHKRIEYPEVIVREFAERREKLGNDDHKPAE